MEISIAALTFNTNLPLFSIIHRQDKNQFAFTISNLCMALTAKKSQFYNDNKRKDISKPIDSNRVKKMSDTKHMCPFVSVDCYKRRFKKSPLVESDWRITEIRDQVH